MSKHNWQAIKTEYTTGDMSLRGLAEKYGIHESQVLHRADAERWSDARAEYSIKVASEAETAMRSKMVRREVSARVMLFDVIDEAVAAWRKNPKASTRDLAELLRLGLAAQGETTERTAAIVSEEPNDTAIMARIGQIFDGARARGDQPVSSEEGNERGAGWTD